MDNNRRVEEDLEGIKKKVMTQIGLADKRSAVQGRSPLGGPEGARFRFPGGDWQTVPGFPNDNIANPEGSGDWTTCGFLAQRRCEVLGAHPGARGVRTF